MGHAQQRRFRAIQWRRTASLFECMFTSYMDDYVPAVIREINSLSDVFSSILMAGRPSAACPSATAPYVANCRPRRPAAFWHVFNDRVFNFWPKYDAVAKEKKPDSFFFANLGGNVSGGANLSRLGKSPPGSRPTIRAAPTMIPRSGDAASPAGPGLQCRAGWEIKRKCYRCLFHRSRHLAQFLVGPPEAEMSL